MIVVTATFVAEPLQPPLEWLLSELGLQDDVRFSPYNQIFQQLLNPESDLRRNIAGNNVLLVRFEDFFRDAPVVSLNSQMVESVAREFMDAFEAFANQSKCSTIVAILQPGPNVSAECARTMRACADTFYTRVQGFNGVQVVTDEEIEIVSNLEKYDPIRDQLAHIPYTENHFASLALAIARKIHAARVNPAKVLVLDCDNTIWRGVVGEDGVDGLDISNHYAAVQAFAVDQHAKGVLVCLVSKNVESDVLEALEQRPDMRLGKHHLVGYRINWESKPQNIRSLAAELGLGLDTFVFLDDNPIECAQMRTELPQVVTIQVPAEVELPKFVRRLWNFDKLVVTTEDAKRTQMYRENAARRTLESSVGDIGQFLASLELKIDIAVPAKEEWARLEQLTRRTNQFNFTTRRRSEMELRALLDGGTHVYRVRAADRFGDYGIVGCLIAANNDDELLVDTFLLSCRVLGRGVEHAMIRKLGELAESEGKRTVTLPYIITSRNVPARAFADSVAAEYAQETADGASYRLPAGEAARTVHRPGFDPIEIVEARLGDEKKAPTVAAAGDAGRSDFYSRLAHSLVSGSAVLKQIASGPRWRRSVAGEPIAPAFPLEVELLQLWEDLLRIDGLGVEDNFFDLGGTSLLSVRLFAEIADQYKVELRLTAILEAPTVRSLARLVASSGARRGGVICLRRGGARNLFLIHDGLGETLLYLNLAKRLPPSISVYGIEPKRLPGIPLAHVKFEDMAEYYVDQIRQIQPDGPYILGGMCAGGVIAYEMATRLVESGQGVEAVIILDGATPQATRRSGLAMQHRFSRLREAMDRMRIEESSIYRWPSVLLMAIRKAARVITYEIASRAYKISIRLRFILLRYVVSRDTRWPRPLRELSVLEIYNLIESRYKPRMLKNVPTLLVRASTGNGLDTPHREIYRDQDFGWRTVAERLELLDVAGGHSSMLQEHAVDSLVSEILRRIPALTGTASPTDYS